MENKYIEYSAIDRNNTVAKIGKDKWIYPKDVNYSFPITFIEVEDFLHTSNEKENKLIDMIQSAVQIKPTEHMDYLIIKTENDLVYMKSTHWSIPKWNSINAWDREKNEPIFLNENQKENYHKFHKS